MGGPAHGTADTAAAGDRSRRQDLTPFPATATRGLHLLAALDYAYGAVLGQVKVDAKTDEFPMFSALLDRMNIGGAVITRRHPAYPA